jgi:hypothetical protein
MIIPNDVLHLSNQTLQCKVVRMKPDWAEENLQAIRTLMERSALYRRALAPIMLFAGGLGVAAATIGIAFDFDSLLAFTALWTVTAVIAIAGAFLIARRQALGDKENFWSPPTRRVGQALLPPLFAGMLVGFILAFELDEKYPIVLTGFWLLFYGCALHSAGFFMPRGIRLFGWVLIIIGCILLCFLAHFAYHPWTINVINANWLMGFFFGVLHLAYGVYLYLTERKNRVA